MTFAKDPGANDLLKQRTLEYARRQEEVLVKKEIKEFIVFRLGQEWYLIEMDFADEIVKYPRLSQFPRQKDFMLGAMNIRGRIILGIDLGVLLNIGATKPTAVSRFLIIKSGVDTTGFLIEEIFETLRLDTGDFQEKMAMFKGPGTDYIKGFYQKDGRPLIWLDIDKILSDVGRKLAGK